LRPGGWLQAQCGGGPNVATLRKRADRLAATPRFARFFRGFSEPWFYADAEGAAETLRQAGFVNVKTSTEPAFTVLDDAQQYAEFIRNIILRRHLEEIPEERLRAEYIAELTAQSAKDAPAFSLDYWRLNLSAHVP